MSKIIGSITTTPMAIPDWNQDNPNKADYIKNKPEIISEERVEEYVNEKIKDADNSKQAIKFENGLSLESREDGIYLVKEEDEYEVLLYSDGYIFATDAKFAENAENADYAYYADADTEGRTLKGTITIDSGDEEIANIYLEDGYIVSYGIISNSLMIFHKGIENMNVDFMSGLYFTTPSVMPENYSQCDSIYFKGDSVVDSRFVPEPNTRYTIGFFFDGNLLVGYVSGVPAPEISEEDE